ncbi:LysR family transcriptional regulator [Cryptosporangium arvum]|uniref:LysR family transcriptional regulator n=1 Tax=Cryptosporangium arvum TaxID=80871 RepID=UPI0004B05DB6|nr:LysR family transcriptional regulator [Cryptosporangium arvum]
MPELDLRHLRYLIAVAETGSITRAAGRLTITQPALSRAVRALERTVGVPLFVRGSRSTELTDAGRTLLAEAYTIVDRSRAALDRARVSARAETLSVTVPACDVRAVAAVSRSFEKAHPDVTVDLKPYDGASRPDELRAGRADVAFLRDCFDRRDIVADEVAREPRMVLLPVGHPLASAERLTLADLRDEPVPYWSGMSSADADHWAGAGAHRGRSGPRAETALEMLAAVVLGRAVAFAHGSTLQGTAIPGVLVRPVEGLAPSRLDIALPAHTATRAAKEFVDHAHAMSWEHGAA